MFIWIAIFLLNIKWSIQNLVSSFDLVMCWFLLCTDCRGPRSSGIRQMACSTRRVVAIAPSSRVNSSARSPRGSMCWSLWCTRIAPFRAPTWSPGLSWVRPRWRRDVARRDHGARPCCTGRRHVGECLTAHRGAGAQVLASRRTFGGFFSARLYSLFVSLHCSRVKYMIREV